MDYVAFIDRFADRIYHVHMKDVWWSDTPTPSGVFGGHLPFGHPDRYWEFRSLGRGRIDFEEIIRHLNAAHYDGPLSIEWEDIGMDREHGAARGVRVREVASTSARRTPRSTPRSRASDAPTATRTAGLPQVDRAAQAVRVGGLGAVLAGVVFLGTIAYTFGFLFARGLSIEMLNEPARLLPWVHAHTVAYVGLWWIFTLHLLCLLPAPRGLAMIVGAERATIRMATAAGDRGRGGRDDRRAGERGDRSHARRRVGRHHARAAARTCGS